MHEDCIIANIAVFRTPQQNEIIEQDKLNKMKSLNWINLNFIKKMQLKSFIYDLYD